MPRSCPRRTMERTKFETYAGFAIRAGKLVRGTNAIKATRKRIYSLFLCGTAAENTRKEAFSIARKTGAPLYVSRELVLAEAVHKENCKLVAFLDRSLSEAAERSAEPIFERVNYDRGCQN